MAPDLISVPALTAGLADVLPAVVRSLGVSVGHLPVGLTVPPARRAVVVLVDGLGATLLRRRSGHAPFLRSLLPTMLDATCGFPSTTATSMGTFGTGLLAGGHGLVGYEVLDPQRDVLLNELSWQDGPVPEIWQDQSTLFEIAEADGVAVTRVGPGFFDGSGLTRAALRGGRFVAADALDERVDATIAAASSQPRTLTYLYWGDLDKVGHTHGCASWEWGQELAAVDKELARLAQMLPADCSLTITADHGMVDVPHTGAARLDVAHEPDLAAGVRHVGGEPRGPQLYCVPGALEDVRAAWAARLGTDASILTRGEAQRSGLFGPVRPQVADRIGDLVVLLGPGRAVVDSRRHKPWFIALIGLHGSTTLDETSIPVLHLAPGGAAIAPSVIKA